mmetsp:Transcript_28019/g.82373  ORF Transcript_28019/g.82373 Transcript_28019/m.82373 type:complete len:332 (-) Transcript_28019:120-1115(-)
MACQLARQGVPPSPAAFERAGLRPKLKTRVSFSPALAASAFARSAAAFAPARRSVWPGEEKSGATSSETSIALRCSRERAWKPPCSTPRLAKPSARNSSTISRTSCAPSPGVPLSVRGSPDVSNAGATPPSSQISRSSARTASRTSGRFASAGGRCRVSAKQPRLCSASGRKSTTHRRSRPGVCRDGSSSSPCSQATEYGGGIGWSAAHASATAAASPCGKLACAAHASSCSSCASRGVERRSCVKAGSSESGGMASSDSLPRARRQTSRTGVCARGKATSAGMEKRHSSISRRCAAASVCVPSSEVSARPSRTERGGSAACRCRASAGCK